MSLQRRIDGLERAAKNESNHGAPAVKIIDRYRWDPLTGECVPEYWRGPGDNEQPQSHKGKP